MSVDALRYEDVPKLMSCFLYVFSVSMSLYSHVSRSVKIYLFVRVILLFRILACQPFLMQIQLVDLGMEVNVPASGSLAVVSGSGVPDALVRHDCGVFEDFCAVGGGWRFLRGLRLKMLELIAALSFSRRTFGLSDSPASRNSEIA